MTAGRDWTYQLQRITLPPKVLGTLPDDVVDDALEGVSMQIIHRTRLNHGWLEGVQSPTSLANLSPC